MKNMIKTLVVAAVIACTSIAYGHYHRHHGPYHYHHHSYWGSSGRYFWPGFAGGLFGTMLYRPLPLPPPPVVVAPPAVVPQPVVVTPPAVVAPPATVIVR